MAAHPCMSMVTRDAGQRGHVVTRASRGEAEGKQRGRASREQGAVHHPLCAIEKTPKNRRCANENNTPP